MILFKEADAIENAIRLHKKNGKQIGYVPTMGALHKGHMHLIENAQKGSGITVCSIFVNPTQFNDPADYKKYPVTIDKDIYMLESAGTDIVYLPAAREIYPDGTSTLESYDLGYLETVLEGKFRPGHFQGVCQVMSRLLTTIRPQRLYMGQKDYQQCMVVKRLIEILKLDTELIICATVREPDRLAMSSRNKRLNEEERKKAVGIFKALDFIKENIRPGNLTRLKNDAITIIKKHNFKIDYLEIAEADALRLTDDWDGKQKLVALAAGFMNEVRLIDNMLL